MCSSGIILIDIFFKNPMQCQMTCRRNVAARALGAWIISKNPGRDFARRRTFKNKKKSNLIMGFGAPILHQICLFSSWVYVLAGAHMGVRSWACVCICVYMCVCVWGLRSTLLSLCCIDLGRQWPNRLVALIKAARRHTTLLFKTRLSAGVEETELLNA